MFQPTPLSRISPPLSVLALFLLVALALLTACAGDSADDGTSAGQTPEEHTAAMSKEHEGDTPEASPATVPEPAVAVSAEKVAYGSVDGAEVMGYMARPEARPENEDGAALPGLIVIQEWWGLNENIEAMTRRLAGEGYLALAVDLYDGEVGTTRDEAQALATAARENPEKLDAHLKAAYAWLESQGAETIGSIGWCFGGGLSLRTAILHPQDLDAAVIYYGRVVTDPAELEPLEVPILGLFGAEDKGIPVDSVRAFESALQELDKEATIHVYEGADHAFANPSGTRYEPAAAERAWAETTAFLARHLKGEVGAEDAAAGSAED